MKERKKGTEQTTKHETLKFTIISNELAVHYCSHKSLIM